MKNTFYLTILLLSMICVGNSIQLNAQIDEEVKVLFIGNSYTGVNNLPNKVKFLAESMGKVLITEALTPGGATLSAHVQNAQTYTAINSNDWDFVVIQAQSQEPSFPPSQVASDTYPYATILNDSIKAAHPCAEVVFFMTWGRKNGDAANAQYYPVLATYEGMQTRLRQSYLEMAQNNDATCAPVGAAWQWVRNNYPAIELYSADESHPSNYGTYLAACAFYSTFFVESPVGASYFPTSISQADATVLQTAADTVVVDSLDNWRINANLPDASFNYVINQNTVNFTSSNQGNNIVEFLWDFNDASIGYDVNPIHTFPFIGIYNVMLIASTNCASDTSFMQITISSVNNIDDFENDGVAIFPNPFQDELTFNISDPEINKIQLINIDGKILNSINCDRNKIIISTEQLSSGIYFLHLIKTDEVARMKIVKL